MLNESFEMNSYWHRILRRMKCRFTEDSVLEQKYCEFTEEYSQF